MASSIPGPAYPYKWEDLTSDEVNFLLYNLPTLPSSTALDKLLSALNNHPSLTPSTSALHNHLLTPSIRSPSPSPSNSSALSSVESSFSASELPHVISTRGDRRISKLSESTLENTAKGNASSKKKNTSPKKPKKKRDAGELFL
jgi:hypothetical protein